MTISIDNVMPVIKLLFQTILLLLYNAGAETQRTMLLLCRLDPCEGLLRWGIRESGLPEEAEGTYACFLFAVWCQPQGFPPETSAAVAGASFLVVCIPVLQESPFPC